MSCCERSEAWNPSLAMQLEQFLMPFRRTALAPRYSCIPCFISKAYDVESEVSELHPGEALVYFQPIWLSHGCLLLLVVKRTICG